MKIHLFHFLLFFISLNSFCQDVKQTFILKINGKEYIINEGQEIMIDSVLSKPVITVASSPYKTFEADSVSFQYPKNMAYQLEQELGVNVWTFNGNDFVIMYFQFAVNVKLSDMVDEMVKKFGEKNCKLNDINKRLGNKTLNGKRINISLVGQKMTMDLLEIKRSDGKSRLIVFQDSVSDFNYPSEESQKTLKLIDNTINYH